MSLTEIKCKHCDKTFPSPAALQKHMTHVTAGKAGGYRKHKEPRPRRTQPTTALDRWGQLRVRKEEHLAALEQIKAEMKAALVEMQSEYEELSRKLATYAAARKAEISVREEMEAHRQDKPS
jgi:Zinc finger, C2H2 type